MPHWLVVFAVWGMLLGSQGEVCFAQESIITTVAGGSVGDDGPATRANLNFPTGVFVDGAGNIYIADKSNRRVRKVVAETGIITTVAGGGIAGDLGDGGPATSITLSPTGVFVDGWGNIYVSDTNRIRKVVVGTGVITTVAGNGTGGYGGDDGPATSASLYGPGGVFVDGSGNIFIADSRNHRIRKVAVGTGIISTVVGNGVKGYSGDGGAATSASLNEPQGVFVDSSGNIYIVDYGNERIRKVTAETGVITTVAGGGVDGFLGDGGVATSASLYNPTGIYVDGSGDMYISSIGQSRIRKVANGTGIISTVTGGEREGYTGDGSAATRANLKRPAGVFVDGSGNIYIADMANHRIRKVAADTGIITTVAGGSLGDGGAATRANLNYPAGVFVDDSGNIYIADRDNNLIRKVAAETGIISTVAGDGSQYWEGEDGPATRAGVPFPNGVSVDGAGNIYIGQTDRIRKVIASTGIISRVAGKGRGGEPFSGDGGTATSATLLSQGIFVDDLGNIYIADTYNNRIRKVAAATGIITTVAGNGANGYSGDGGPATSASLGFPGAVCVDDSGNIYASTNSRIRKVAAETGIITTVAGGGPRGISGDGDGGPATSASLYGPYGPNGIFPDGGVFVDAAGNIYIADTGNNRIRKVAAETGIITTVAGNGIKGYSGDDGPPTSASLNLPRGLFVDSLGNIYIADSGNNRIRKVTAAKGSPTLTMVPLDFGNVQVGQSRSLLLSLINTGTAALDVAGMTPLGSDGGMFSVAPPTTLTIVPGETASVMVTFTPTSAGTKSASLSITHNAAGGSSSVTLSGTGTAPTVALSSASLNAGEIPIGTSKIDSFMVGNAGTAPLVVADITSTSPDAAQFRLSPTAFTLNPGYPPRPVRVTFTPTSPGAKTATYSIVHNAPDSPTPIPLSMVGTGTTADLPKYSGPTRVSLPAAAVGSTTQQTFTIGNPGGSALVISEVTLSGAAAKQFKVEPTTATILAGGTQVFTVSFAPTAIGNRVATASIVHNAQNSPTRISLSGRGGRPSTVTTPQIQVSTATVVFSETVVGASTQQTFTVGNRGGGILTISQITATGAAISQFRIDPQTAAIPAGANQVFTVTFTPTTVGTKTVALSLAHNATGSPARVRLQGSGVERPALALSATTLVMDNTAVGTSSQQGLTISNGGRGRLSVSLKVGGADSAQFAVSPAGLNLGSGQSQVVVVVFSPSSSGLKSATLTLTHNAPGGPAVVALSGTGTASSSGTPQISLSPASLVMDQTVVGGQSQKILTINNTGDGILSITEITLGGSSGRMFSVDPSSASIPGGGNRSFTVTFKPTSTGLKTATLNLVHNAQGSPATVRVRGQAIRGAGLVAGGEGGAGAMQKLVEEEAGQLLWALPAQIVLEPNYPNPFNSETTIGYQLPADMPIKLEIYDLLGRRVRTLIDQVQPAGFHRVAWEGRDEMGRQLATGVYLYRLETSGFRRYQRMVLLR